jgi:hypothetical protein
MTIAHGLAQGDNVRNNVLAIQLEGPHVATDSSETNLDLIRDTNASSFARVSERGVNPCLSRVTYLSRTIHVARIL